MTREIITKGTELQIECGYIKITDANGSGVIYADEYFVDEDGNERYEGERCLTIPEIELMVKAVDGKNHNYFYAKSFSSSEWAELVEETFQAWTEGLSGDEVRGTTKSNLDDWFWVNSDAEPASILTEEDLEDLKREILKRCPEYGLWYAVQHDSAGPWDDGYKTEYEAVKAANRQGADIIAVIDTTHADPFCLRELHRGEDF